MKKISIFILLISLSYNIQSQNKKTLIRDGNNLYNDSSYNMAEMQYRKSLEKDQDYFNASFNLADAIYKQERYEESSSLFDALKDNAKNNIDLAKINHNLGNSLLKENKTDQAIEAYKDALRNNPKDEQTRYNLAYAQKVKKQEQEQKKDKEENKEQKKEEDKEDKKQEEQEQEKENKDQDKKEDKKQEEQKKEDMSKEDAEKMLEALQQREKELQEKLQKKKVKGQKIKILKDW
jgi:Ca-activated chloride channel family protein